VVVVVVVVVSVGQSVNRIDQVEWIRTVLLSGRLHKQNFVVVVVLVAVAVVGSVTQRGVP
jgi:hypothetical protein